MESAYDRWKTTEEDDGLGEGHFECASPDCGHLVENEGEWCDDCEREAIEDEKADRIRKGDF